MLATDLKLLTEFCPIHEKLMFWSLNIKEPPIINFCQLSRKPPPPIKFFSHQPGAIVYKITEVLDRYRPHTKGERMIPYNCVLLFGVGTKYDDILRILYRGVA